MKRSLLVCTLLLGVMPSSSAASLSDNSLELTFSSQSITKALTNGGNSRGPALAVMKDDTVLLGGGQSGGELLTWNQTKTGLRSLGKFIPSNRREIDSRFAISAS